MLRGKEKHAALLKKIDPEQATPKETGKLIDKKFELLLYRYYFYTRLHKMSFDQIAERLKSEFFISSGRIMDIVGAHAGMLKEINDKGLTPKELWGKFPWLSWPVPALNKGREKAIVFINQK